MLNFFVLRTKFNISSILCTKISQKKPDKTFIIGIKWKGLIRFSARNQKVRDDMNLLMRKGIKDLRNATGGGHPVSSGAKIQPKDLEKFKENILK